jgi:molybdate transport system substrate-binding protein
MIRFLLIVLLLAETGYATGKEILVAAASSIREPLDEVIDRFQSQSGIKVQVSYGSSGKFTHQILRGAPYDLFLSADEQYPQRIRKSKVTVLGPQIYAVGVLSLYDTADGGCGAGNDLKMLIKGLETRRIRRIAIANPELAPYGRAAREALENSGVWSVVHPHLVYAANVAQAAQYSLIGAVDCAFIARSHAISPHLLHRGVHSEVSRSLHAPLNHAMVLLSGADNGARSLFNFLAGAEAASIFKNAGFVHPDIQ